MNHDLKTPEKLQSLLADREHGSIDIARELIIFLLDEFKRGTHRDAILHAIEEVIQTFPWMAVFEHLRFRLESEQDPDRWENLLSMMLTRFEQGLRAQAEHTLAYVKDGMHIALYSNSASYPVFIQKCREQGIRQLEISIAEALPHREGLTLYKELLACSSYRVRLWRDPSFFSVLSHVDALFVSCDFLVYTWAANKVGTYPAVRLIKSHGKKAYLFAFIEKIIPPDRASSWIERILTSHTVNQNSVILRSYELDLTPLELFDRIITPEGAVSPECFRKEYRDVFSYRKIL